VYVLQPAAKDHDPQVCVGDSPCDVRPLREVPATPGERCGASPPHGPREGELASPTNTSRPNLAHALGRETPGHKRLTMPPRGPTATSESRFSPRHDHPSAQKLVRAAHKWRVHAAESFPAAHRTQTALSYASRGKELWIMGALGRLGTADCALGPPPLLPRSCAPGATCTGGRWRRCGCWRRSGSPRRWRSRASTRARCATATRATRRSRRWTWTRRARATTTTPRGGGAATGERASWVTLGARGVMLRARWLTL
jgi:hypothetical protein